MTSIFNKSSPLEVRLFLIPSRIIFYSLGKLFNTLIMKSSSDTLPSSLSLLIQIWSLSKFKIQSSRSFSINSNLLLLNSLLSLTEMRLYVEHTHLPACLRWSWSSLLKNLHSLHSVQFQTPLYHQRSCCWQIKLNLHMKVDSTLLILWSFIKVHITLESSFILILCRYLMPDLDLLLTNSFLYPLHLSCKKNFLDHPCQSAFLPKSSITWILFSLFDIFSKNNKKYLEKFHYCSWL